MTETLDEYGLVLLFGILALQAMGVGGLPGKTALVTAAILAAAGHFLIWQVIGVAVVAVALGGYAGYLVGRKGGRRLVERPWVQRRASRPLALAERFFESHGAKAVFVARFFPGVKVVIAPAAGIAGMPWRPFALWHTLAALGFALVFGLSAYYAGRGAIELVELLGFYALVPLAAAAALAWLVWTTVRRRRSGPSASGA